VPMITPKVVFFIVAIASSSRRVDLPPTRWIIAIAADYVKTCTAALNEGLPCPWAWGRIGMVTL